ncbi:LEM-3-like GIY-YIG domain-containing protein [Aquimarina agarivorans]|uniref:LEM-3-like GIY-YIG domain-containing protein n=1 Tax=Aquimarina agarivorans TaxID=980584 RepID=UPI000248E9A6|nr:hypothetical protein [Aquimarina agarivorans]
MFDNKTIERLGYYVYALIDPITNLPFYIGKGVGNRVFNHKYDAENLEDISTLKLDTIREINSKGFEVKHIIIRHGLKETEAFEVEASLIDFGNYIGLGLSNIVEGHHVGYKGLMTTDEIIRLHNAAPLHELQHPVIIININRKYKRGESVEHIYHATKQAWVIGEHRRNTVKYALSEYTGIIIEVFEIHEWYNFITEDKRSNRWGFHGKVASDEVRNLYINKSIAHTKKKGAANPIKYRLD